MQNNFVILLTMQSGGAIRGVGWSSGRLSVVSD